MFGVLLHLFFKPKLQKGGIKIPKWTARSCRGIFVGFSLLHSATVGLICNVTTHSIIPQFHVIYDDHFSTVDSTGGVDFAWFERLLVTPNTRHRAEVQDPNDLFLSDEWLTPSELEL